MTTVAAPMYRPAELSPTQVLYLGSWVILSVAAGYRWFGVGADYGEYVGWWSTLTQWSSVTDGRFELLFATTGFLFKQLGFSYGTYATFLVAISLGIKFRLIYKHTETPTLALISYICIFYFLHEYTQIRAAVAIAFGLLAVFACLQSQYLVGGAWLLLAATFQSSILALGIGILIAASLASVWRTVAFMGLGAVTIYLISTIDIVDLLVRFNPLSASYIATADDYDAPNILSPQNVMLVIAIVAVITAKIQKGVAATDRFYIIMCVMALVTFALFYDIPAFANRLFGLFFVFVIFLSFQSRRFDLASVAGFATLISAVWAVRNAVTQHLIG